MMYGEFLRLTGQDISCKQYDEVIEPMYMATDMSKADFINLMMPTIKAMAKENTAAKKAAEIANQRAVFVGNGTKTPNGCYFMGEWKKEVKREVNIATGKVTVTLRDITTEELRELGWDWYLSYHEDYRNIGGDWYDIYNNPVSVKMAR